MLARSIETILSKKGFDKQNTLLATSLCCDEVCRDMEDELKAIYGQNFAFGGVAGFPFGGCTAFGAMCHHIPIDGNCIIVYGSHVGIDHDGVVGKVNRRGHQGSGACCNTAIASLAYVKATKSGMMVSSPDPSDPIDAQQVFVDVALMKHSDRLLNAVDPNIELPHVVNDCQTELFERIVKKCTKDIPDGSMVAILGGIQINTPEGTPEYFLPKNFTICDSNGEIVEDLLEALMEEGHKDPMKLVLEQKLDRLMEQAKDGLIDVPMEP